MCGVDWVVVVMPGHEQWCGLHTGRAKLPFAGSSERWRRCCSLNSEGDHRRCNLIEGSRASQGQPDGGNV
jgi:hypothetical protein